MFAVIRHYHFNPKDSAEITAGHARTDPSSRRRKILCATIGSILVRASRVRRRI
jgi:hypothetical protein